jgi:hypothetical protein
MEIKINKESILNKEYILYRINEFLGDYESLKIAYLNKNINEIMNKYFRNRL